MSHLVWFASVAACATLAAADIRTPVLGYVHDAEGSVVRPILGMPGASLVGDALPLPFPVASAAISARHDYMVAVAGDDSGVWIVVPVGSGFETRLFPDLPAGPLEIVLSPSGAAAAIRSGDRIEVFTGMPMPTLARRLSPALLSQSGALTVSDDGALVLAGAESGARVADGGGQIITLAGEGVLRSAAFRAGSHDAILTWNDRVEWWSDPSVSAAPRKQWTGQDGIDAPVGAAFSVNGGQVLVAQANGDVLDMNADSGIVARVSCGCTPLGLSPLDGASVFQLTGLSRAPMQLASVESRAPRVFFVPALTEGGR